MKIQNIHKKSDFKKVGREQKKRIQKSEYRPFFTVHIKRNPPVGDISGGEGPIFNGNASVFEKSAFAEI